MYPRPASYAARRYRRRARRHRPRARGCMRDEARRARRRDQIGWREARTTMRHRARFCLARSLPAARHVRLATASFTAAALRAPVLIERRGLRELDAPAPLAPMHQPHNLAAIDALAELRPDTAAGCMLRHRLPSHAAAGRPALRFAARADRDGRAALRLPRLVVRVHRRRLPTRRPRRRPRRRCPSRQRRQPVCDEGAGAASPRRWASRRWTACRWARAAARSTPASSCTCSKRRR